MAEQLLDKVGSWTELKLQILHDYAKAYALILNKQKNIRYFDYIDGFAGAGSHITRKTGRVI